EVGAHASGYHTMTRDPERNRVGAADLTHGARRGAQLARDLTGAARAPRADGDDVSPHTALKRRALKRDRQIEAEFGIFEIALDLRARPCRNRVPRRKRSARFRQERDFHEHIAFGADAEQREWRRQFGLIVCARGALALHEGQAGSRAARMRTSWIATTTVNRPRPTT